MIRLRHHGLSLISFITGTRVLDDLTIADFASQDNLHGGRGACNVSKALRTSHQPSSGHLASPGQRASACVEFMSSRASARASQVRGSLLTLITPPGPTDDRAGGERKVSWLRARLRRQSARANGRVAPQ